MKKQKTAVRQIYDTIAALHEATPIGRAELLEYLEVMFEVERVQIVSAWIQGNNEGWDMTTDWPEHGERYYEEKYIGNEKGKKK